MIKNVWFLLSTLASLSLAQALPAAESQNKDPLTQGMVKITIKVGETTQSQILEAFGAPNISTMDAGDQEVWVYDRHATISSSTSSGFAVGIASTGGSSAGGLGFGRTKNRSEVSTRSMTLIIKFAKNGVVSDFKSRSSSF